MLRFVRRVRRAFTISTLCFAWLCANGALWDCAQVFAWGKMVHDYSQTMPMSTAIEKTFDGSAPCEICDIVQEAQQNTPAQQAERTSAEKVILVFQATDPVIVVAPEYSWPGATDRTAIARTELVHLRPPRV